MPSKLDLVEIFALALCLHGCSLHKWRWWRRKKASWSIYTYICWYKAVFSCLGCMARVSVQDTIVWAFAEPCVRDARLYCIYLYYFWKAVKWKWFVTMFHVNSNKRQLQPFHTCFSWALLLSVRCLEIGWLFLGLSIFASIELCACWFLVWWAFSAA